MAAAVDEKDKTGIDPEKVGVIPFIKDEETIQDVMAFTGTGPEVRGPGIVTTSVGSTLCMSVEGGPT